MQKQVKYLIVANKIMFFFKTKVFAVLLSSFNFY